MSFTGATLWLLQYSLLILDRIRIAWLTLRIGLFAPSKPKKGTIRPPVKHLALKLEDRTVISSQELQDLVEFLSDHYGVQQVTVYAGVCGFPEELKFTGNKVGIEVYWEFRWLQKYPGNDSEDGPSIRLNLIARRATDIFLEYLADNISDTDGLIKSFSKGKPSYICMYPLAHPPV